MRYSIGDRVYSQMLRKLGTIIWVDLYYVIQWDGEDTPIEWPISSVRKPLSLQR